MANVDAYIVKQAGFSQPYNRAKLQESIYASCLSVFTPTGEAAQTALMVAEKLEGWLEEKIEVTSHDIRIKTHEFLHDHNPHAAIVYLKHKIIS